MTVITLTVLTFLVVGFLSTMLVERQAASAYEDSQQAKFIAQGAVGHAIDLLRTNIPEPARLSQGPQTAPARNWATNPGRLTIIEGGQPPRYVPLHTGEVTSTPDPKEPRDAESVDLNQPLPGQTTAAITGTMRGDGSAEAPPMRVRWVNLLEDPASPASNQNKLSARYAFWMDDESARLNFNVAAGKPIPRPGDPYTEQVNNGYLTPSFLRGSQPSREWGLGRPQSINLDVLFDDPQQFKTDKLLDYVFLHGFMRYPEAVLNFVDRNQVTNPAEWYQSQKFNLTAYSRSPEFNAFGRPRLVTTYIPLSLEGGTSYQHPFIYDPTGAFDGESGSEILHLNALLGTFGFGNLVNDDDGGEISGSNIVNEAQVNMLNQYLHRLWPGQTRSFVDKYGEAECYQIALNAALFARMATTQINNTGNLHTFTKAYAARTTSVNYSPSETEVDKNRNPERMYWRYNVGNQTKLFLPQTPGPHITEVKLYVKSLPAPTTSGYILPRYIQYWYDVEYYMHPFGPPLQLAHLPTRVDYFDVNVASANPKNVASQVFGNTSFDDLDGAKNWNAEDSLRQLQAPPYSQRDQQRENLNLPIGPGGRVVVRSQINYIGEDKAKVPIAGDPSWKPKVFEGTAGSVSVQIRFRPGMGVGILTGPRPRQMIPLGETPTDTLQATFNVPLIQTRDQAVSWQISDPRLSANLAAWEAGKTGPGDPIEIGTMGTINVNEPAETEPEKSKYRYLMRSMQNDPYDRGDEYDTRGRVSSPGYWSLLHTGIQANIPWRTLELKPTTTANDPPDWLLLDLMAPVYPMATSQWQQDGGRRPDEFSTISFMNSTAGQVNLNSRIYPHNAYFKAPERRKPLEAVFANIPGVNGAAVAAALSSYQTDTRFFDYTGRAADAGLPGGPGVGDWASEFLLRNMAGCLTTKSNTFGVWGVAQVVKKLKKNTEYDTFERGDRVLAEKRFHAVIERYVWAGVDGVPGNAHTNGRGRWDKIAEQTVPIRVDQGGTDTLFQLPGSPPLKRVAAGQQRLELDAEGAYPEYDGPEEVGMNRFARKVLGKVKWQPSRLDAAYNPPQPVIKYRVVSFRYLDQ